MAALLKQVRHKMRGRPKSARDGEPVCEMPLSAIEKRAEVAMIIQLLCDRKLFGWVYSSLHPDDEEQHVPKSGVLVMPTVPTKWLSTEVTFPGDIDVLAIPYEGDELLIGQTLAVEVKVIRASFAKQGKSPNEYGFSQANGLLQLGIPYAGVVHLIVSDKSPPKHWRTMWALDVLDTKGRLGNPREVQTDMLPADLINRAFNRLIANSPRSDFGLTAVYLEDVRTEQRGMWVPSGRTSSWNSNASLQSILRIAELYEAHASRFLETPRYAP